jgi:streptomycin 6-kinase
VAVAGRDGLGRAVVLKVQFPDRESEHEADALVLWDGDGAVRLIAHDPGARALLVERCEPGAPLSLAGREAALDVLAGQLSRLWRPATEPFTRLTDEAARWAKNLLPSWERAGRPFPRRWVDDAVALLQELSASQGEQVLLDQDLHGDNVLRAEREPWLVIDPKPLVGEREMGLAPIIRSGELGHDRAAVIGRLDRLSDVLGLDRERARGWAFAQTLAWAFEGGRALPGHLDVAGWLASAG